MARTEQSKQPPKQSPGFAAGSEGWDGTEDPTRPVTSSEEKLAQAADQSTESTAPRERDEAMQSDYALSQSPDDQAEDGRFSVSEEQNFDQQSDEARRVGRAPQQAGAAEATRESMQQEEKSGDDKAALKQAVGRAVPPSD